MVRTKQASEDDRDVHGDERKRDRVPLLQHDTLVPYVRELAPGERAPRITRLADRRLYKRREVPAAPELVLDAKSPVGAEVPGPLGVDLAFEVECAALVGEVAGNNEEDEGDPEEEGVDGEEGAVVEEDASPSDEGGEDTEDGCKG